MSGIPESQSPDRCQRRSPMCPSRNHATKYQCGVVLREGQQGRVNARTCDQVPLCEPAPENTRVKELPAESVLEIQIRGLAPQKRGYRTAPTAAGVAPVSPKPEQAPGIGNRAHKRL
jgi:hypothetical protein